MTRRGTNGRRPKAPPAPEPPYIHPSLWPYVRPIGAVTQDPRNPMTHGQRNLEAIRLSLQTHGQVKPIVVDPAGIIRAGNGTHQAATALGWAYLAAVEVADTEARLAAYAIADNRVAQLSEWHYPTLTETFKRLQAAGLPLPGWTGDQAAPILAATWEPMDAATLRDKAPAKLRVLVEPAVLPVLKAALDKVRADAADGPPMTEGRALELLCADYLAGPGGPPP